MTGVLLVVSHALVVIGAVVGVAVQAVSVDEAVRYICASGAIALTEHSVLVSM